MLAPVQPRLPKLCCDRAVWRKKRSWAIRWTDEMCVKRWAVKQLRWTDEMCEEKVSKDVEEAALTRASGRTGRWWHCWGSTDSEGAWRLCAVTWKRRRRCLAWVGSHLRFFPAFPNTEGAQRSVMGQGTVRNWSKWLLGTNLPCNARHDVFMRLCHRQSLVCFNSCYSLRL